MEKIDLFTLISLIVAVVVILKLRSVLGRRTGDEEARARALPRRAAPAGRAAPPPPTTSSPCRAATASRRSPRPAAEVAAAPMPRSASRTYPGVDAERAQRAARHRQDRSGLRSRSVHPRRASQAYEMIVTAFAEGNRKILKDLLSRDVYRRLRRAPSPSARRAASRSTRASSASTRPTSSNRR